MALPDSVKKQLDEMKESSKANIAQVEINLEAFSAGNVDAFLAANRLNDIGKITKSMMPFFLKVPPVWGKVDDIKTFENLPLATWKQLSQHIADIIGYLSSKN
jgi:cation transport regulator ChaB